MNVQTCPACGQPVDYCQGHGEIGDPRGAAILELHDFGEHSHCHPASYCRIPTADMAAYERGELSTLQTLELFGVLIRSGKLWDLPGRYSRGADELIGSGLLDPETGSLTDLALDMVAALDEED